MPVVEIISSPGSMCATQQQLCKAHASETEFGFSDEEQSISFTFAVGFYETLDDLELFCGLSQSDLSEGY
ncbi:hypothetical protein PILCRDRAFT_10585 [Piloderma croceum F 1598]|uniref:Uncharacterized protein n=1 Tax=Piloderma croceum (strain F 1598) TaxID=765440 RepID=A0A0C3BPF3_PILCF|nr:hypothetical protein PILCRDRAFT_10585 [Piloderma croceum F 1598]